METCDQHSLTCERLARIETRAENLAKEVDAMGEKQDLILAKIDLVTDQLKTWMIRISTVGAVGGAAMFVIQNWATIKGWIN